MYQIQVITRREIQHTEFCYSKGAYGETGAIFHISPRNVTRTSIPLALLIIESSLLATKLLFETCDRVQFCFVLAQTNPGLLFSSTSHRNTKRQNKQSCRRELLIEPATTYNCNLRLLSSHEW